MSMDIDGTVALPSIPLAPQNKATILCHRCGSAIDGTTAANAMCYDCLKLTVDASDGIQREATLHTCRDCERWLQPPAHWLAAAPESRELMALCLRKLKGLSKVRIIDCNFIWTEAHSRRVKLKVTVQQEAYEGTIVQQTFEVVFVVAYQQCPDCMKSFTVNTWRAVVQVRQKVPHKRTFLYLEQLILKHGAHQDTINIKEEKDGLDFFFAQQNHAVKFVDFLKSTTPVTVKDSQELISMDIHTSKKSYKFTYSCELVPICKDDLVALPLKLARSMGNIAPMVLAYRVGTTVNVMDPNTLQTADIAEPIYRRAPFAPLADVTELVEFTVLDIEPLGVHKGRFFLSEATVARSSDLGVNDTTYFTRTHLGGILHPGDAVMGYLLSNTNFNNPNYEAIESNSSLASQIPDVVLVKKSYTRSKRAKNRKWRLKRMTRDEGETIGRKQDPDKTARDWEMFQRELEEDEDLRNTVSMYKAKANNNAMEGIETASMAETDLSDDVPKINVDDLLDDFDDLDIDDEE